MQANTNQVQLVQLYQLTLQLTQRCGLVMQWLTSRWSMMLRTTQFKTKRRQLQGIGWCFAITAVFTMPSTVYAQQFVGDNQWVAPYGVSTLVATAGEEYSQFYAIASLVPEWEFNLQLTHYYDDPQNDDESFTATNLFVKRRLLESEDELTGYSILAGTGQFPEHKEAGQIARAFENWWVAGTATYAFFDNNVLLDFIPGVTVNFDSKDDGDTVWGFTWASRAAWYGVIPQSAIVAEVFGTAGEAYAAPSYRVGVRWESRKLVAALTYSEAFDGSTGAGFEIGIIYFTEPRFCWRGCR